jgi:hypothetical protein
VGVNLPKPLFDKLMVQLTAMRKTNPMASLSDAIRLALEMGLR